MKEEVKQFFERRFAANSWESPTLDGVPFSTLSQEDNDALTCRFDEGEIKEAMWECEGDKSPGPDGFNFKFIKEFWHLLKYDFL